MRTRGVALAVACALWASAAASGEKPGVDLAAAGEAMRQADAAMSRATVARDIDGFLGFLGDDVVFLAGGVLIPGKPAVREAWKDLFEESGPTLSWRPTDAVVASSADLGYTVGTFELAGKDADGTPALGTGEYVTIWKKQADGAWRVLFDAARRPAAAPSASRTPSREAISKAGDLAVVIGSYEGPAAAGTASPAPGPGGAYLAIRRKGPGGAWTVAVDTAVARPPASR